MLRAAEGSALAATQPTGVCADPATASGLVGTCCLSDAPPPAPSCSEIGIDTPGGACLALSGGGKNLANETCTSLGQKLGGVTGTTRCDNGAGFASFSATCCDLNRVEQCSYAGSVYLPDSLPCRTVQEWADSVDISCPPPINAQTVFYDKEASPGCFTAVHYRCCTP